MRAPQDWIKFPLCSTTVMLYWIYNCQDVYNIGYPVNEDAMIYLAYMTIYLRK